MFLVAVFIIGIAAKKRPHIHSNPKKQEDDVEDDQNKNIFVCQGCKTIARFVKKSVLTKTVEEAHKFLTQKCPNISYLNKVCQIIDPDIIDQIINNVDKDLDVEKYCYSIKMC